MKFLYAAYAVTWAIHLVYLVILRRGFKRAKQEMEELKQRPSGDPVIR